MHAVPASALTCTSYNVTGTFAGNRRKKLKQLPFKRTTKPTTTLSYPKSSPTPLLLPSSAPLTLDRLLADIQSSLSAGIPVDPSIFSSLLDISSRSPSPSLALRLLRLIPRPLLRRHASLSSKLLRLLSLSGLVHHAHHLFDLLPHRSKTAFAWNSLFSGYAELGLFEDAIALYFQMDEEAIDPDEFTFPRVLKACAGLRSLPFGFAAHRHAVRAGLGGSVFVLNALVDMYAKCGDVARARRAFDAIAASARDAVSWNAMLTAYVRHGLAHEALRVFREMFAAGIEPNSITLSTMLARVSSSCSNELFGLEIHGWVLRRALDQNLSVANALVAMYGERKQFGRARVVFDKMPERDLVSWNTMISVHRKDWRVFRIFERMEYAGVLPDAVTFVSLLSACANLGSVEVGRRVFDRMRKAYKIEAKVEHYGCMVNMLGRAGLVNEAYELANAMPFDGGVTVWGALLYACSVHGDVDIGEAAAERLFELEPDNEHNFVLMMKIYENSGRMEEVQRVRGMMKARGLDSALL